MRGIHQLTARKLQQTSNKENIDFWFRMNLHFG